MLWVLAFSQLTYMLHKSRGYSEEPRHSKVTRGRSSGSVLGAVLCCFWAKKSERLQLICTNLCMTLKSFSTVEKSPSVEVVSKHLGQWEPAQKYSQHCVPREHLPRPSPRVIKRRHVIKASGGHYERDSQGLIALVKPLLIEISLRYLSHAMCLRPLNQRNRAWNIAARV